MKQKFTLKIPATSANLGPGFDCCGLALDLLNIFTIEASDAYSLNYNGNSSLEDPKKNLVVTEYKKLCHQHELPEIPFHLHCQQNIPFESGLGSSSTAVVAAAVTFTRLHNLPDDKFFWASLATQLEGHSDNVVPAIYGGFAVATMVNNKLETVANCSIHNTLFAWILLPNTTTNTQESRNKLSQIQPMQAVLFNIAHSSLLTVAFFTNRFDLLSTACADKIHEHQRLPVEFFTLRKELLNLGVYSLTLSGSGPALLVLLKDQPSSPMKDAVQNYFDTYQLSYQQKIIAIQNDGMLIT